MGSAKLEISVEASSHFSITEEVPDVPNYQLIRMLKGGAFGEVWLARSETDAFRAVKLIPKGRLTQIEIEGLRTFENLARRHPNIIDIRHVGFNATHLYYVMDLADGIDRVPVFQPDHYRPRTLESDMHLGGAVPLEEAIYICTEILAGLEYLHTKDLLHRDVKPANIVFVQDVPKLADIGLITERTQRRFEGSTPLYAPPEGVVDRTGDLYCLGKMLFEMVTGTRASMFPELPPSTRPAARVAATKLMGVFARACADEPRDRFESAAEFRAALEAVLADKAVPRRWDALLRSKYTTFGTALFFAIAVPVVLARYVSGDIAPAQPQVARAPARMVAPVVMAMADIAPPAKSVEQPAIEETEAKTEEKSEPKAEVKSEPKAEVKPEVKEPVMLVSAKPGLTAAEERLEKSVEKLAQQPLEVVTAAGNESRLESEHDLGVKMLVRGDVANARTHLKQLTSTAPNFAPAWRTLGLAFEKTGKSSAAARAYEKYLALAPDADDASAVSFRLASLRAELAETASN